MNDEQDLNTPSPYQVPSGAHNGSGSAWVTWIVSSSAIVVLGAAAAIYYGAHPKRLDVESRQLSPQPPSSPDPAVAPLPQDPLNIAAAFLDAQKRAKRWNTSAMLVRIELVVVEGKSEGPIVFTFGPTTGQPIAGRPLSPPRLSLSVNGETVKATTFESTKVELALPDPNCPLEVAYRNFRAQDDSDAERVGVIYAQSGRHDRPVWLMTRSSGKPDYLSGEGCVFLRK